MLISKRLFLSAIACFIILFVSGQQTNYRYDSLIRRVMERNIEPFTCENCPQTGICVIEVSKTDSITIRILYASDGRIEKNEQLRLAKRLNEKCNNILKEHYSVIVPVHFYYEGDKPSDELMTSVNSKLKLWKETKNVAPPVILIDYGVQRKKQTVAYNNN